MEVYLSRAGLLMRFSYFLRTLAPLSSPSRTWLLLISLSGDSCELMAMISSSVKPESCSRCLFQLRRLYLCRISLTMPRASSSGSYLVKVALRRKSLARAAMSSSKNSTSVLLSPSYLKSTPQVRQKSRKVMKVACCTSKLMASKMVRSACSQSCCEQALSAQRWQRLRYGTFLSSSTAFPATMSAAEAQNFSAGCNLCSSWQRQSASARVSCVKRNLSQMAVSSWQVSSLIQRGSSTFEADLRRLLRQWWRLKWKGEAYLLVLTASPAQWNCPQATHLSLLNRCWHTITYRLSLILVLKQIITQLPARHFRTPTHHKARRKTAIRYSTQKERGLAMR